MKLINASYKIISLPPKNIFKQIEKIGRTCYKSEDKITPDSATNFVKMILKRGHESVIEHSIMSIRFIVDRGVSHEIVRHRLAAYSQESTRYCNYGKKGEVTFIKPSFWTRNNPLLKLWKEAMKNAELCYLEMLKNGASPQEARSVLPNSLKTEIVMTANLREWRHVFKLRTGKAAHPQMREVMIPLLNEIKQKIPIIFDDIIVD